MRKLFPLLIVFALLCAPLAAQDDYSQVQIETVPVADGIHMLVGAGGNIGVASGEDGIFLIDDQFAPLTEKIFAAVKDIDDGEVRFVLNTHWHFDHTGGNENMGKAGVLIVAHEKVRELMSVDQFLEAFQREIPAAPKAALPVVTFNDTITFHLNGEEIHAFHVEPAHTNGDSIVHFRNANVVHMGDTFFNGFYPFIDVQNGGGVVGMIAASDRVLAIVDEDTKIIPGHGPLASKKDLQAFRDMLQGVHDAIAPHVKAGKSLEEVQAADPLKAFNEVWGKGFLNAEVFTAIVYNGLKKNS